MISRVGVLVVVLGLLLFFSASVLASSSDTFYSVYDGSLGCERPSYLEARNSSIGYVYDSQTYFDVGQWEVASYTVMRAGLFFNTSSIPEDAVIKKVDLLLYGFGDHSDTDFDICAVPGDSLSNPMKPSNYHDLLRETEVLGSLHTSEWIVLGYNTIEIETSVVNKEGITGLALRSSQDMNSIAPSGLEYVEFCMSEQEGVDKDPMLVVTYSTRRQTMASSSGGKFIAIIAGILAVGLIAAFAAYRIRKQRLVERR